MFVFKTSNGDPTLPILSNLETDFFKFLHFNTFASFLFSYTIHNTQYTIHNTYYLVLTIGSLEKKFIQHMDSAVCCDGRYEYGYSVSSFLYP